MNILTKDYKVIAKGLKFPEGPIWMDDGSIILVEIARGTLSRVLPSGEINVVANLGGGPNGAATGAFLAGFLFDLTGGYNFGFFLCSVFTFCGAVLFWTIPQIRHAKI